MKVVRQQIADETDDKVLLKLRSKLEDLKCERFKGLIR